MDLERGGHTGVSRRDMIKRAAAVGAVAWATPMVVDSLASPAGALTPGPCVPYWVKLVPGGACYPQTPGSGAGRVCGVNSGSVSYSIAGAKCGSTCTVGCSGGATAFTPSSFLNGSGYYEVTLTAGSSFSSGLDWTLGGRYGPLDDSSYTKVCAGAANSGDGSYVDGGVKGYLKASVGFTDGTKTLSYIYIKFCRAA